MSGIVDGDVDPVFVIVTLISLAVGLFAVQFLIAYITPMCNCSCVCPI
jgi:hypothetical protein